MKAYMLDTNICIYAINHKFKGLAEYIQAIGRNNRLLISSITLAELEHGVFKSTRSQQNQIALSAFLIPFEIVDFDDRCALKFGMIANDLYSKGTPIGCMDMLIAAHALSCDAVLVTHNIHEFSRIKQLVVEDWVENTH